MKEADAIGSPIQSFPLLRRLVPNILRIHIRHLRKILSRIKFKLEEPYYSIYPFTQVHIVRQRSLVSLVDILENEKIDGAFVECGVMDGGTAALLAFYSAKSKREIHLFDSWEGLPKASVCDGENAKKWEGEDLGSISRVKSTMALLNIDMKRVFFHKGWFRETFNKSDIDKIALLHIDADFYESVKLCLEKWFQYISPGGFIQIDDYDAFIGCRKATLEFLENHPYLMLQKTGTEPVFAYYIRKPLI